MKWVEFLAIVLKSLELTYSSIKNMKYEDLRKSIQNSYIPSELKIKIKKLSYFIKVILIEIKTLDLNP